MSSVGSRQTRRENDEVGVANLRRIEYNEAGTPRQCSLINETRDCGLRDAVHRQRGADVDSVVAEGCASLSMRLGDARRVAQ